MYAFQSESTLYSYLNVKELLARSRREIWRWSDCNWTRTQNHLVLKRTLNHLAKLAKWLSCVVSTYLYGAFDCILSFHVCLSESMHNPHSQHSSIIWPVWLNIWVLIYELSGCGSSPVAVTWGLWSLCGKHAKELDILTTNQKKKSRIFWKFLILKKRKARAL